MAMTSFRMVAACCASLVANSVRSTFVTPSTISATAGGNWRRRSSRLRSVSSTTSCNRAAAMATGSWVCSATIRATATGWLR